MRIATSNAGLVISECPFDNPPILTRKRQFGGGIPVQSNCCTDGTVYTDADNKKRCCNSDSQQIDDVCCDSYTSPLKTPSERSICCSPGAKAFDRGPGQPDCCGSSYTVTPVGDGSSQSCCLPSSTPYLSEYGPDCCYGGNAVTSVGDQEVCCRRGSSGFAVGDGSYACCSSLIAEDYQGLKYCCYTGALDDNGACVRYHISLSI